MSYRCCVANCNNTNTHNSKATFYAGKFIRFPDNKEKRQRWNQITGSNTDVKKYICSEHFTDNDWRVQDIIMNVPLAKRKIKPEAVPSRKLPKSTTKINASDIDSSVNMDKGMRKRLVAEALAAYEQMYDQSLRTKHLLIDE